MIEYESIDWFVVCMCVLKGGYRFFSDLVSKIQNENRFAYCMDSFSMCLVSFSLVFEMIEVYQ